MADLPQHLVIASNRLPVRVAVDDGDLTFEPTSGGLVAALRAVAGDAVWVGWPGAAVPEALVADTRSRLGELAMRPVFLGPDEERDFYGRVCNDTLWPLFHYFGDRLRTTPEAWDTYVRVNERFADAVAASSARGGTVWIHDFHLMLVPGLLRERRPDVRIGFFLHIPFPSHELYRLLPAREAVLRGLLGADYVSFHTREYASHFQAACLRMLGLDADSDGIVVDGRTVTIGVDPIGVDVAGLRRALDDAHTAGLMESLECRYAGRRLILGVERLDYTKGIPQKLRAFERYLEAHPDELQRTKLLQILVPSRLESTEYRAQRDEIELEIARINGRFGRPGVTPIEYVHRSIPRDELMALYRRADAMLVTPLRDGMNLVAQEFVLAQSERAASPRARGALVLSELAGAARVLAGATLVNPWDVEQIGVRLAQALALGADERARRIDVMRARVESLAADRWAGRYLARLATSAVRSQATALRPLGLDDRRVLVRRFRDAPTRALLLDYDGTLADLEPHPDQAAPDPALLDLLAELAADERTAVHIISGRTVRDLQRFLGHLPLHLAAEHGLFARRPAEGWRATAAVDTSWLADVERLLDEVADEVPGAHVERKSAGVAWHYRAAEPEYGAWRARELRALLGLRLSGLPAEVIAGTCVVEVRAQGVGKGAYVRSLTAAGELAQCTFALGAGDDRSDHDLFDALPPRSVAIYVGDRVAPAMPAGGHERFRVADPAALRTLLRALAAPVGTPWSGELVTSR